MTNFLTIQILKDILYQVVSRRLIISNIMSISIQGKKYYRTHEALKIVGISRATFFRWLKEGTIQDVSYKDRRGWRLFTEDDIDRLAKEANKMTELPYQTALEFIKR
jgi:hypothetical protein